LVLNQDVPLRNRDLAKKGKGGFKVARSFLVEGNSCQIELGFSSSGFAPLVTDDKNKFVSKSKFFKGFGDFSDSSDDEDNQEFDMYVIFTGEVLSRLTFKEQLQLLQLLSFCKPKITRHDLAIDVPKYLVPFDKILKSYELGQFVGSGRYISSKQGKNSRKGKKAKVSSFKPDFEGVLKGNQDGDDCEAQTIYFGTRNSSKYSRIYDAGSRHSELLNYYRFEVEFKRSSCQDLFNYLTQIDISDDAAVLRVYKTLYHHVLEAIPLCGEVLDKDGKYCDLPYWRKFKNIIYSKFYLFFKKK
jgi:hypothetical protein